MNDPEPEPEPDPDSDPEPDLNSAPHPACDPDPSCQADGDGDHRAHGAADQDSSRSLDQGPAHLERNRCQAYRQGPGRPGCPSVVRESLTVDRPTGSSQIRLGFVSE